MILSVSRLLFLIVLLNYCSGSSFYKPNETEKTDYKIVCYYTNWAQYRNDPAKYFPDDIDPNLCTHIIFSFAQLDEKLELASFEWNDESTESLQGMYHRTVALKRINKDLKVLIAVGGWNHGSLPFSDMARNKRSRSNFVEKAILFLKKHRFDGLDLDWEYPANRDTENRPEDQIYFTTLCKDLHSAFESHGLILTAAVAAGEAYIKSAYEMDEIHHHLDFINIMAYDLRGSWDNITGHNAPLYTHKYDVDAKKTVDFAVQLWLDYVPANKLVLGIASYGRSFELKDGFESCPLTDTPIIGPGAEGAFSREKGFLTYFEVCKKILQSNWAYVWNDRQEVPYAFSNESLIDSNEKMEWVGFDDVKSVEIKVKYAMENNLGGAMLWALDMDDFKGDFCNQGKYPILTTINHFMNPKLKLELPRYEISSDLESSEYDPKKESGFIVPSSKVIDALSSDFLTTTNAFSLMENDPMQVYKFCQCKNGTHHIKTTFDEELIFYIDCDKKRVLSSLEHTKMMNEKQSKESNDIYNDNYDIPPEAFENEKRSESGFFLTKIFQFGNSATRFTTDQWFYSHLIGILLFKHFL